MKPDLIISPKEFLSSCTLLGTFSHSLMPLELYYIICGLYLVFLTTLEAIISVSSSLSNSMSGADIELNISLCFKIIN